MVLKTRMGATDAVARQSLKLNENEMDTSPSALGRRDRSAAEPTNIDGSTRAAEETRSRGDTPATTMAGYLAVVHAHAQWWPPDLKLKMEASPSATVGGVDGAISARVADECNRISRQELTPEEEGMHADLVKAAKIREFEAWGKFGVLAPHEACVVRRQIVQTRWVLTSKMADGK